MNSPLSVIGEEELLYQALLPHVAAEDPLSRRRRSAGKLSGIITDTDILRLQAHSPHQLVLDIEKAQHLDDFKTLHARIQALVTHLSGTGIPIRDLVRLIAHQRPDRRPPDRPAARRVVRRHRRKQLRLPVLGSEGRGEQTLATDQDNAIVYADDLSPEQVKRIEEFSLALIDGLIAIGVPACKGGIMAKNADWRRSLGDWQKQLARWMGTPTPTTSSPAAPSSTCALPTAHPASRRRSRGRSTISQTRTTCSCCMVEGWLRFTPPIGWFGKIKGESGGEHSGELEIKKAGIFAITDGIKALAVQNKMLSGSTLQRLEALRAAGIEMTNATAPRSTKASAPRADAPAQPAAGHRRRPRTDNYIRLDRLNVMEKGRLKIALTSVVKFQEFLKHHFGLHLVRG